MKQSVRAVLLSFSLPVRHNPQADFVLITLLSIRERVSALSDEQWAHLQAEANEESLRVSPDNQSDVDGVSVNFGAEMLWRFLVSCNVDMRQDISNSAKANPPPSQEVANRLAVCLVFWVLSQLERQFFSQEKIRWERQSHLTKEFDHLRAEHENLHISIATWAKTLKDEIAASVEDVDQRIAASKAAAANHQAVNHLYKGDFKKQSILYLGLAIPSALISAGLFAATIRAVLSAIDEMTKTDYLPKLDTLHFLLLCATKIAFFSLMSAAIFVMVRLTFIFLRSAMDLRHRIGILESFDEILQSNADGRAKLAIQ